MPSATKTPMAWQGRSTHAQDVVLPNASAVAATGTGSLEGGAPSPPGGAAGGDINHGLHGLSARRILKDVCERPQARVIRGIRVIRGQTHFAQSPPPDGDGAPP